jgi:TldD protein
MAVEENEGALARALERLARKTKFVELLAESGAGEEVRLDSKSTTLTAQPRLRGVVFRAWTGRRWAEAATTEFGPTQLGATVDHLEQEIERARGDLPPPGESATTRGSWTTKPKRSLRELGPEGTIALAKDVLRWATAVQGIVETQVRLGWEEEERLYLNSAGARCQQRVTRTRGVFSPIAMENGRAEFDFWSRGGVGGLERVPGFDEGTVRRVAEGSKELLHAKAPPAGETDVVLDPGVAGLFAHESFGHGTEADQFVRDRSYLKPILGQTVGPEFLSIVDDGTFAGGWGTIYCDDEGHPAQKTPLVAHGRFVGALHDRETAALLGAQATANTRRSDFMSRAFVRMTNTYVESGDRTLEELIGDVKSGVFLEHGTSGIEDPLGGQMQLKVKKGHRIENGRLTDLVAAMALSGKVLDFLKATRGVGRRPELEMEPGFCGKGHSDYLPVGSGGAPLLSRAIVGPA